MSDARPPARGLDVRRIGWSLVIAVACVVATADLRSVLSSWSFLVPAAIGAASALGAVAVSRRFGLLLAETLALAIGVLCLVTVFVVGGLPTFGAIGDAVDAVTRSWSDLLSAVPPAQMSSTLRFPPLFLGWLGTLVGALLLLRAPRLRLAVAGPAVTLVLTILLSEERATVIRVVGVAMAVLLCASAIIGGRTSRRRISDLIAPAVVLVAVAVAAGLLGPRLPLASANDRYGLRDEVVPPWNPLSVPSPLVDLKASLADARADDVVFSVASDAPIERFTVAVMRDYDGTVWTVADSRGGAADEFRPVGPELPVIGDDPDRAESSRTVDATITIRDLSGPWLPSPGDARRIEFADSDAVVRENLATGTLAVPGGLDAGTVYTIRAEQVSVPPDAALVDRPLPPVADLVDLEVLPPAVRNFSADLVEGIDRGWGQVASIRDRFVSTGFYDRSPGTGPGHSYFRMGTFLADPEQTVGFEEQYAAAAALIARVADRCDECAPCFEYRCQ